MSALGFTFVAVSFILGSLALVTSKDSVNWMLYAFAIVLGFAGAIMIQLARRKQERSEEEVGTNVQAMKESLGTIVERVQALEGQKQGMNVYEFPKHIDKNFVEELDRFVNARKSMSVVFGLQGYADVMSHFAAGERHLNRVWCASSDGYVDEAHRYIEKAQEQFLDAKAKFDELSQATAS